MMLHIMGGFIVLLIKSKSRGDFSPPLNFDIPPLGSFLESSLFSRLLDGNGHSHSHAHHGVISCADETHHLYVSRNGGGTCELGVRVHTAHGIGHSVGSRTSRHIVGMEGTACAAAGGYGEVFLSFLHALLLIGAGHRMLETGRVGGVSGDGNVNALFPVSYTQLTLPTNSRV